MTDGTDQVGSGAPFPNPSLMRYRLLSRTNSIPGSTSLAVSTIDRSARMVSTASATSRSGSTHWSQTHLTRPLSDLSPFPPSSWSGLPISALPIPSPVGSSALMRTSPSGGMTAFTPLIPTRICSSRTRRSPVTPTALLWMGNKSCTTVLREIVTLTLVTWPSLP